MLKLTPVLVTIPHYQLGSLLKADHPCEALAEFEQAEKLNPSLGETITSCMDFTAVLAAKPRMGANSPCFRT